MSRESLAEQLAKEFGQLVTHVTYPFFGAWAGCGLVVSEARRASGVQVQDHEAELLLPLFT